MLPLVIAAVLALSIFYRLDQDVHSIDEVKPDPVQAYVKELNKLGACSSAVHYVGKQNSVQEAWYNCTDQGWMVWILAQAHDWKNWSQLWQFLQGVLKVLKRDNIPPIDMWGRDWVIFKTSREFLVKSWGLGPEACELIRQYYPHPPTLKTLKRIRKQKRLTLPTS